MNCVMHKLVALSFCLYLYRHSKSKYILFHKQIVVGMPFLFYTSAEMALNLSRWALAAGGRLCALSQWHVWCQVSVKKSDSGTER